MMLLLVNILLFTATLAQESVVVTTKSGQIAGLKFDSYIAFRGVPFAQPPVGSLRFKTPSPVQPWSGVLSATKDAPGCHQNCYLPAGLCPAVQSEDCLYMNIFVPANASLGKPNLPVMFFIHGGSFEMGTGGCPLYDGRHFAENGVVLVTINYRLGTLGFLTIPSIIPLNLGLKDQRLALSWINANAAAFGGNPNMITIFGESAGAMSVTAHLVSKYSKGLYQAAIVQSDPITLKYKPMDYAKSVGQQILSYVGCNSSSSPITCLGSVAPELLVKAADNINDGYIEPIFHPFRIFLHFGPVVDSDEIPSNVLEAIQNGNIAKVPIMWGNLRQEGDTFVYAALDFPLNLLEYSAFVLDVFQTAALEVEYQYPPPLTGDTRPILSSVITDYVFTCPGQNILINYYKTNNINGYYFYFDHILSFNPWGKRLNFCADKVCHGAELPILFGTSELVGFNSTANETALTNTMLRYWTNFAKTNNPNSPVSPTVSWPTFSSTNGGDFSNIYFGQDGSAESRVRTNGKHCAFFDTIGYNDG